MPTIVVVGSIEAKDKPATSGPSGLPLLAEGLQDHASQPVWCADITFIPASGGYLYLVAIMGWATRKVLSWRLSNTMHADLMVNALSEAIEKYGPPEIMNTDQGSQFSGSDWITTLTEAKVQVSMDRGRCMDNIFIERL